MRSSEIYRLRRASRDPAVNFFLLLPLALLHLIGRGDSYLDAFSLIELLLRSISPIFEWVLWAFLIFFLFWSLGRISVLKIRWPGGASLLFLEGFAWGFLLKSALSLFTSSEIHFSLICFNPFPELSVLESLAVASGAGLYEEIFFRFILFGGFFRMLMFLLCKVYTPQQAKGFSFLVSLVFSSAIFSLSHAWGDPSAIQAEIFIFRFFAGVLLGIIYAKRGLAVTAYAHCVYDVRAFLNF